MDGQHKQFLKKIVWFIPLVVAVYFTMTIVFGEWVGQDYRKNLTYIKGSSGHVNTRLKDAGRSEGVDLLFLGSSHAYRGFDTRIFQRNGWKCFNLGSSSQTAFQTDLLLSRYLDKLSPKVVVFEVYPEMFCVDGIESSLDILANDETDLGAVKMAMEQNNIRVYNTLIYGFYADILGRNKVFKEPSVKGEDTYISGGYVQKKLKYFRKEEYPANEWEFNEEQFKEFEKILSTLEKRKIRIILVQAPITRALYTSYSNNQEFDRCMAEYGAYFNFNNKLTLDDSLHFYDRHHLNQKGVEIFNNAVLEIIKQHP